MREAGVKEKGQAKTIRIVPVAAPLAKPAWIRVRAPSPDSRFYEIKSILREQRLHTVCEEASCPNIGECFGKGTATFMILGDICTRSCGFCAVKTGRPTELDLDEPRRTALAIRELGIKHAVITSVNRDELDDGGASIFAETIRQVREISPGTRLEVLTPDFLGKRRPCRASTSAPGRAATMSTRSSCCSASRRSIRGYPPSRA